MTDKNKVLNNIENMETQAISLTALDIGTILDALELRQAAWERTVIYFDDGQVDGEIEECADGDEAKTMKDIYTNLINSIRDQSANAEGQKGRRLIHKHSNTKI